MTTITSTNLAPVPPHERLLSLDVLRGLALAGVLMGNMMLYTGDWARGGGGIKEGWLDEAADWFLVLFVRSKAQTMLTLLFGLGFAMQLVRAEARGEPAAGMFVRRMAALFGIGALHMTLVWWGDVTWGYAVAGLGMLAFTRVSNRVRIAAGLALTFVPLLVTQVPEVQRALTDVFLERGEMRRHTRHMITVIASANHAELAWEHPHYALVWCARIYGWYFLWTLGRFLLGYVAGQRRWFARDGADHLPVFRRLAAWGGAVSVVTSALVTLVWRGVIDLGPYGLAGRLGFELVNQTALLATSLAYAGIIVLLLQRATWRRILGLVAPAGRMPLTTYVAQSALCTFLFYGWGLGWTGQVTIAGTVGLSVAIFTLQVIAAHLWLRAFQLGPLEWLWRTAVYLRPPPMRYPRATR